MAAPETVDTPADVTDRIRYGRNRALDDVLDENSAPEPDQEKSA